MMKRYSIVADSIKSETKQRFLQKIDSILSLPCSVYGYQYDIQGAMDEMNITLEEYLRMCLNSLSRQVKTPDEIQMLYGYMFFMKGLTTMLLKIEKKTFHETLQTLASHLGYEHHEKDKVLFRLGDKGRKAYIILKGSVTIIIGKQTQMRVYTGDYMRYLANLLRYKEYGLANKVLNDNYQIYPIELLESKPKANGEQESQAQEEEKKIIKRLRRDSVVLNEEDEKALIKLNQKNQSLKASIGNKAEKYTVEQLIAKYDNNEKDKDKDNDNTVKDQLNFNNISPNDYVKRFNIINTLPDTIYSYDIISAKIYSYVNIISSNIGSLFGDIALSDPLALRTATIITNTECYFGTLNKNSYNISLKTGAEKQRRQNVNFILSLEIFSNIPQNIFQKKHFNNFTLNNCEKGTLILTEGDTPNSIYLIKEGNYEVTLRVSLNELTQLLKFLYKKQTDSSLLIAELESEERHAFHMISENWKFGKLYHEKKLVRVSEMSPPEIAGLDDFIGEKGLISFSLECKSPKGEYYQINHDLYNEMATKDVSMRTNEESFLKKKLSFLCKRLLVIRKSNIQSFFDYKDTFVKLHINKEMNDEFAKGVLLKRKFEFKTKIETIKDLKLKTSFTSFKPIMMMNKTNNNIIHTNNDNNITGNESGRALHNQKLIHHQKILSPYSFQKPKKILSNLLLSTGDTTNKPKEEISYSSKNYIFGYASRNEGKGRSKKSLNGLIEITRESNYFTRHNLSEWPTTSNINMTPIELFNKPSLPVSGVHLTAMVWENVHQKSLLPICQTEVQSIPQASSSPKQSHSQLQIHSSNSPHSHTNSSSKKKKNNEKTFIKIQAKTRKEKDKLRHYKKNTIFLMRTNTKYKDVIDIGKYTQMKHDNYIENRNKYLVKDYNRVNLKILGGKYK